MISHSRPDRESPNGALSDTVFRPAPWQRPLDLGVTLAILPLVLPLVALLSLLLRLDSPGPVFFRQERLGQGGRRFTLLKLRSMRVDADEDVHRRLVSGLLRPEGRGRPWRAPDDDPRVTRFGRFLRRSSLDELPQLVNVLRGEMSLVGPRPALPYEAQHWSTWHHQRLAVRPGLTGLWQVGGRELNGRKADVDFDGMVRLDLDYIQSRSLALDLWILGMTPLVIWRRHRLPQIGG